MSRMLSVAVVAAAFLQVAGCPFVEPGTQPGARVQTSHGEFVIAIDTENAPRTSVAFYNLVVEGFYDDVVVQRVVPDNVVQVGEYALTLTTKETRDPIVNESDNGLPNLRGTVAMARTDDPDSAAAQFFVNLVDNAGLDPSEGNPGYAVFGRVVDGMDVLDEIAALPTTTRDGFTNVPEDEVFIESVARADLTVDGATVSGVRVRTTLGTFSIQLFADEAPLTVANFLQYVDDGFYPNTLFHRVMPDFVVQGGGLTWEPGVRAATPIEGDAQSGSPGVRGTVAMTYNVDLASVSALLSINLTDNAAQDATAEAPGNLVFGSVVEGLDVVEQIAALQTGQRDGLSEIPLENVIINNIEIIDLATGEFEVTPAGQAYTEQFVYGSVGLVREFAVSILGQLLVGG